MHCMRTTRRTEQCRLLCVCMCVCGRAGGYLHSACRRPSHCHTRCHHCHCCPPGHCFLRERARARASESESEREREIRPGSQTEVVKRIRPDSPGPGRGDRCKGATHQKEEKGNMSLLVPSGNSLTGSSGTEGGAAG